MFRFRIVAVVAILVSGAFAQTQNLQQQRLSEFEGKPADIALHNPTLKTKFAALLGASLKDFSHRLEMGALVKRQGDWLVAEGFAPHSGGSDEAAFAINVTTGMVFAIMWVDGQQIRLFGVEDTRMLPPPLLEWYRERGGIGCSGTSCTDYGIQRADLLDVVKASLSGNKNGATAALDGSKLVIHSRAADEAHYGKVLPGLKDELLKDHFTEFVYTNDKDQTFDYLVSSGQTRILSSPPPPAPAP